MAYEAGGLVWIGVRPKGSPLKGALGLHTGSNKEHYLEATVEIHGIWGVAFGAVSPEIERVEVRNERGESFPGRIVPLPVDFEEESAWGIATECRKECRLIGYDNRGRLIDSSMIRPRRHHLSAEETLELIRTHCDNGLRYTTWALKKMPSIPEQAGHVGQVQNHRHALAMGARLHGGGGRRAKRLLRGGLNRPALHRRGRCRGVGASLRVGTGSFRGRGVGQ
jgi:hypothetical protein